MISIYRYIKLEFTNKFNNISRYLVQKYRNINIIVCVIHIVCVWVILTNTIMYKNEHGFLV